MEPADLAAEIKIALEPQLDRWTVTPSCADDGPWTMMLEHPASAGVVLELRETDPAEAAAAATRILAAHREVQLAFAAPELTNPDLVMGLRTLTAAFTWSNLEVRSVAFLLYEHGHLTVDEAAWLGGYEGKDPPMTVTSPHA